MIPLKDENPTQTTPLVTIVLIGLNLVVYFFGLTLSPRAELVFLHRFGAIPWAFSRLTDPFPYDGFPAALTLLTSLFVHGGLIHLAGNMLFLWVFGNNIEDILGHGRFILFYLLCGVAATLSHVLLDPGSTKPLVGASGAVAGVMGAYLVLFPTARVLTLVLIIFYPVLVRVPAVFFLVLWFALQVLNAASGAPGGVAWSAHVGGFISGIVALRLLAKEGRLRARSPRPPVQRRGYWH